METEIKDMREDIKKLIIDVALIKNAFLNEGELSDWAKEELKKAREEKESEYVSPKMWAQNEKKCSKRRKEEIKSAIRSDRKKLKNYL